jgi:hypothetical protein
MSVKRTGDPSMDSNFFRGTHYIIDINEEDARRHLLDLNLGKDMQLILDYFAYFLFIDTSRLGDNEFSSRHQDIKDGILYIMNRRYDAGARQISNVIEGLVRESLVNDGCLDSPSERPN